MTGSGAIPHGRRLPAGDGNSTFPSEDDVEQEIASIDAEQLFVSDFCAWQLRFVERALSK